MSIFHKNNIIFVSLFEAGNVQLQIPKKILFLFRYLSAIPASNNKIQILFLFRYVSAIPASNNKIQKLSLFRYLSAIPASNNKIHILFLFCYLSAIPALNNKIQILFLFRYLSAIPASNNRIHILFLFRYFSAIPASKNKIQILFLFRHLKLEIADDPTYERLSMVRMRAIALWAHKVIPRNMTTHTPRQHIQSQHAFPEQNRLPHVQSEGTYGRDRWHKYDCL